MCRPREAETTDESQRLTQGEVGYFGRVPTVPSITSTTQVLSEPQNCMRGKTLAPTIHNMMSTSMFTTTQLSQGSMNKTFNPQGSMPLWSNPLLPNLAALEQYSNAQALPPDPTGPNASSNINELEVAELEQLLDFVVPDEKSKRPTTTFNTGDDSLQDGFDTADISILYDFLSHQPESNVTTSRPSAMSDVLNLNMFEGVQVESLLKTLGTNEVNDTHIIQTEKVITVPPSNPPFKKSRQLCQAPDCLKRSRSNGLCISHGGGHRCIVAGCGKSSQGGNLCIRHGGGKRCIEEGCDRAAQSNQLCKAHGGGPRCKIDGCSKSSQGGGLCRTHGGGKRCGHEGCNKGTQRGDFCALHGGSRLCEVAGCMRNDRGGGLCAMHGGGKRCSMDGCNKPCRRRGLCSAHGRLADAADA